MKPAKRITICWAVAWIVVLSVHAATTALVSEPGTFWHVFFYPGFGGITK